MPRGRSRKMAKSTAKPPSQLPTTTTDSPPPIITLEEPTTTRVPDVQPTPDVVRTPQESRNKPQEDEEEDEFVKKIKEAAAAKKLTVTSSIQKLIPTVLKAQTSMSTSQDAASFFTHAHETMVMTKKKFQEEQKLSRRIEAISDDETDESSHNNDGESGASSQAGEQVSQTESATLARESQSEASTEDGIIDLSDTELVVSPAVSSDEVIALDDESEVVRPSEEPQDHRRSLDDEMTIRVKLDGKLEKFFMHKDDKLEQIFKSMAQKLHSSVNDVSLVWNDFNYLRPSDTGRALGLGNVVILECVRMEKPKTSDSSSGARKRKADDGSDVLLKFQTGDRRSTVEMVVSKLDTFEIIKTMYLKERGLTIASGKVKFQFDGEKVPDNETPADLDMDDGDCVDVIM